VFGLFFRSKYQKNDVAEKILNNQLRYIFDLKPRNIDFYKIALIHKSASTIVSNRKRLNNERLEYLGDSILDAIVADFLFSNFPNQNEGFLTKMRSRIVSRASLNTIATAIGLDKLVVAQTTNPLAQKHIYGDALEALIGAIYLDKGFEYTQKWLNRFILSKHINLGELQATESDYKSRIIEIAQKNNFSILFESIEKETPKGQNPLFEAKLLINQQLLGTGYGTSKKEAEQNAAMVAIERIDIVNFSENLITPESLTWEN
jgi:ribonuclease III